RGGGGRGGGGGWGGRRGARRARRWPAAVALRRVGWPAPGAAGGCCGRPPDRAGRAVSGLDERWRELVGAAVLGTQRRPPPAPSEADPLEVQPEPAEASLLARAAVLAVARRAAGRPAPGEAALLPAGAARRRRRGDAPPGP